MKRALISSALLWLGACATASTGSEPALRTYSAAQLYRNVTVSGASFSHDETRILFSSDATGVFNVYAQPVAGGVPTQLTDSKTDSYFAVGFFPDDDRFLYIADQGGNELHHLYVQDQSGKARDLTPGDRLKAAFGGFAKDGRRFFVWTNERDPKAFDLYEYAADDLSRAMLFENQDALSPGPVSPDGRHLALVRVNDNADSDVLLVDLSSGERKKKRVTPAEGTVQHGAVAFTRDGAELYYATDEHGEFRQVWRYELSTGERRPAVVDQWDVMNVVFSHEGRYTVTTVNVDASTKLNIFDRERGKTYDLPALPSGDITGAVFSRSEQKMAFYVTSDRTPANLFVLDTTTGHYRQLTSTQHEEVDPKYLVDAEVVRYPSFDGLPIPAILYRPRGASSTNRAPALIWVHGGPGGQSRRGYSPEIQHLVNHGYAVLAVNNRGSSGYGKTFYHLDDRRHGEVDLEDVVSGKTYLAGLDYIDGSRIGVLGGSYGGFMVVAALAFRPEVFALGIDVFGVTNWVRTLESIPPWWAAFRQSLYAELGDPATDKERLTRISPLFSADKIKKPLLVVQGKNDPRVLKVESDELVAAVKKSGVPVEYVVFEDEGHGFQKRENRITASEAYLKFLKAHL